MKYATVAWKAECLSWRSVIQLNVIRSTVSIVETIRLEMISTRSSITLSKVEDDTEKEEPDKGPPIQFSDKHHLLKLRLGPLRRVKENLRRRLGASSEELQANNASMQATPFDPDFVPDIDSTPRARRTGEFVGRCWQDALRTSPPAAASSSKAHGKEHADADNATEVIASCRSNMKALWQDKAVQARLMDSWEWLDECDQHCRSQTRGSWRPHILGLMDPLLFSIMQVETICQWQYGSPP